MLKQAVEVTYQVLDSGLESLLIEAELIKRHQPKFNILLKDDKSPLYVIITDEEFPRVLTARKKQLTTTYAHLSSRNVFGPYPSATDAKRVIKVARQIFRFCSLSPTQRKKGKPCFYTHIGLCRGACVGNIDAAEYHQMIKSLKAFLRGKTGTLQRNLQECMQQASGSKDFERAAMYRDQIQSLQSSRKYLAYRGYESNIPELASDGKEAGLLALSSLLSDHGIVPRGYQLHRIEAYDISTTQSSFPTASMVVLTDGAKDPTEYKRFKIQNRHGIGDTQRIREVIERRSTHLEWPQPQLIIIDGGKGQLKAAMEASATVIPIISLVKRPDRLLLPTATGLHQVRIPTGSPLSLVVTLIRDEAHRFAKSYHTKLRDFRYTRTR